MSYYYPQHSHSRTAPGASSHNVVNYYGNDVSQTVSKPQHAQAQAQLPHYLHYPSTHHAVPYYSQHQHSGLPPGHAVDTSNQWQHYYQHYSQPHYHPQVAHHQQTHHHQPHHHQTHHHQPHYHLPQPPAPVYSPQHHHQHQHSHQHQPQHSHVRHIHAPPKPKETSKEFWYVPAGQTPTAGASGRNVWHGRSAAQVSADERKAAHDHGGYNAREPAPRNAAPDEAFLVLEPNGDQTWRTYATIENSLRPGRWDQAPSGQMFFTRFHPDSRN